MNMGRGLLDDLFARHYADGPGALARFRHRLSESQLGFDVESSIRERTAWLPHGFHGATTSLIYYYVSGTQFGSVKKLPAGPDDTTAHVHNTDGIGLNMGCPIRLARALDVLFSLKAEDRAEPLALLKAPTNHFACVEELLWLTLWNQITEISRGGELTPRLTGDNPTNVDWFFFLDGTPIYLEVKYRPSDWLRAADGTARKALKKLFQDIGKKFPTEKSSFRKCLAAITGFAEPDPNFLALCESKLLTTVGLNCILYRSLLGQIYVCGLDGETVAQISRLIRFPNVNEYPFGYPVHVNRGLRQQRTVRSDHKALQAQGKMFCAIVPTGQPTPSIEFALPNHSNLVGRNKDGEPVFETVPPFLDSSLNS